MKKITSLLIVALGAGAGCIPFSLLPAGKTQPLAVAAPKPSGPVSADQVNDTNAYDKAEELRREMDKENQKSEGPAGKSAGTKVLP